MNDGAYLRPAGQRSGRITHDELSAYYVTPETNLKDVIACVDRNGNATALVVDAEQRLLDIITDGDLRRAILAGLDLKTSVNALRCRRIHSQYPEPVTAPAGTDDTSLLRIMQERSVRQIPILDDQERVVGLVFLRDLVPDETWSLQAVIMAGGFGKRMLPLTEKIPKPMLPVSEKPLLEHILQQVRCAGVRSVNLTTHYKADFIAGHFGDGKEFGVEINYIQEDKPLGTAGALSCVGWTEGPILIINGDILTRVNIRALCDFHRDNKADMTVGVRLYEISVPYGVIETNGVQVTSISEKPTFKHFINGGIYLLNQEMRQYIPSGERFDMPELIMCLVDKGHKVVSFPIHEYWLDIGQHKDYEQAQEDVKQGKILK